MPEKKPNTDLKYQRRTKKLSESTILKRTKHGSETFAENKRRNPVASTNLGKIHAYNYKR